MKRLIGPLLLLAFVSPLATAQFQHAVGVGDVDLDGTPDVVFASPGHTGTRGVEAGRVECRSATGSLLWAREGSAPTERLGFAVAPAGDLDLDGRPDVAVTAPGALLTGVTPRGRLFAISGTGAILWTFDGPPQNPFGTDFGHSVASPGDLDGDGRPDLVVGAPTMQQVGGVVAVSGTGAALWTTVWTSTARFGIHVAGLGDIDANGSLDTVVGCDLGTPDAVALDAAGAVVWIAPSGLVDSSGHALAGPGDVDLDGRDDLLAGDPAFGTAGGSNPGRVLVYSPSAAAILASLVGATPTERLGLSVAALGDMDGDGVSDHAAGGGQPWPFEVQGVVRLVSGATMLPIATVTGFGEGLGTRVAAAGDVNGDGRDDAWITEPGFDVPEANDTGRARALDLTGATVASLVGPVSKVTRFGEGCLPLGFVEFEGDPSLGGTFSVLARGIDTPSFSAPKTTPMSLIVGVSDGQFAGVPLPLDLGPLGVPGCSLNVSMDGLFPATYKSAQIFPSAQEVPADVTFTIPSTPAFVGVEVHFQWLVDPPGTPTVPVGLTEGLRVTVLP